MVRPAVREKMAAMANHKGLVLIAIAAVMAVLALSAFAQRSELLISNVVKRVRMWREVEPFYPDQTRGLPKSSESRGTEAVMNAHQDTSGMWFASSLNKQRDPASDPAKFMSDAATAYATMALAFH